MTVLNGCPAESTVLFRPLLFREHHLPRRVFLLESLHLAILHYKLEGQVGETRVPKCQALQLGQRKAWLTGHPGGVTTIHANSARAALTRLSSLVQEAGVPPQPELIAETIDLIAFIVRTPEGRKVTELVRVKSYDAREGFRLEAA